MGNLWVGCDMGMECENPAIADGVFAVALDRAHAFTKQVKASKQSCKLAQRLYTEKYLEVSCASNPFRFRMCLAVAQRIEHVLD